MKAFIADYNWHTATDLAQALSMLHASGGKLRPFAGGTDLMVLYEAGKLPPGDYLNLWNLDELRGIRVERDHIVIGALATYADVAASPEIAREFPILRQAALVTGAAAIQNRGTIGGNIANASPAADTPPVLLVCDTEIELVSAAGARWLSYRTFHLDYKRTQLQPGELIRAVRLPRRFKDYKQRYRKVGTRKAQAISKVCFAATYCLATDGRVADFNLALGSVAPTPLHCRKVAAVVVGQKIGAELIAKACAALVAEIAPIDDIRSTRDYRLNVAENLLRDLLETL